MPGTIAASPARVRGGRQLCPRVAARFQGYVSAAGETPLEQPGDRLCVHPRHRRVPAVPAGPVTGSRTAWRAGGLHGRGALGDAFVLQDVEDGGPVAVVRETGGCHGNPFGSGLMVDAAGAATGRGEGGDVAGA